MDWIYDPTAWAGLGTLVLLEIVLGIDNLIFIAILSDKLPPHQRQKARVVGLSLALLMRLFLLAGISYMSQLTEPVITILNHGISVRDLIMIFGGGFLLFKGTMELHEKLEGSAHDTGGPVNYASFWQVIAQIVVLDAVFSLDAVITAVGMVEHLPVMMIAVVIAIMLMMLAANPLMNFVSRHPTVVILCLGFLLMIGFSLVVEGLGFHIPKGYLYAAIGFSVIIEAFNQFAQRNRRKLFATRDLRNRTAQAVLSILGGKTDHPHVEDELADLARKAPQEELFGPQERQMITRVLQLGEQSVQAIMTPRRDIDWINLSDSEEIIRKDILESPYSSLVVSENGEIEEPLGIIQKKEIADFLMNGGVISDLRSLVRQPVVVPENATVLQALDIFRKNLIHVAFVVDEYGTLEGFLTLTDVAEAIAGDLPEEHDDEDDIFRFENNPDGSVTVSGALAMQDLDEALGIDAISTFGEGDFHTVAGLVLDALKHIPRAGDEVNVAGYTIKVVAMDGRRIERVIFRPAAP